MANWKLVSYEGNAYFPEPGAYVHATLVNKSKDEIEISLAIDEDLGFRCKSLTTNTDLSKTNINSVFLRELNIGEIIEIVLSELRKQSRNFPAYIDLKNLNSNLSWSKRGNQPSPDVNYAVLAKTYEFFSSLGSNSVLIDIQDFLGDVEIEALKKRVAEARRRGFLENRTESLGRNTQGLLFSSQHQTQLQT